MSTPSEIEREKERLNRLAQEYVARGYHVSIHPPSSELPDFLQPYRPDMLASSDSENVVIDVMTSGSISSSAYMPRLASAIQDKENWRYELVMTNPRSTALATETADILDPSEISSRLNSAKLLTMKGDHDAATLLLWTAIEASMRRIAEREHTPITRKDPTYLVKRLYTLGLLSRSDYRVLLDASRTRNTIAHGFKYKKQPRATLAKLMRVAEKLIRDASEQPGSQRPNPPDA
jgi:hypothetical protein